MRSGASVACEACTEAHGGAKGQGLYEELRALCSETDKCDVLFVPHHPLSLLFLFFSLLTDTSRANTHG